ncbi:putative disease resistance protein RGA4 [Typha angustifolia]|uniref:putative disease resistance protein RGA4 n=1 Tax=Typha angustifolia TaxID=59011 RepID=UPI003C2ACA0E
MAEAVAISVARWVASPIVSRLLNEGFNYLGELGDADVKERLENLETTILPQFHLVIEAAERSNDDHKAKLKLWLRKLKDAMYEAEDMLDLCKYQLLEEKVHDLNSDSISKSFRKVGRGLSKILSHQNKKLGESLIKLDSVAAEAIKFHKHFLEGVRIRSITANNIAGASGVNVTTSLPPHYVIGRDEERDEIIDKYLLDPFEDCEPELSIVSRSNYSVVVVTGIGGAGKTTLAQLVYNDQRVVDNFGIKMWVCMSRKLDVFKLIREMIESAFKKKCPRLENLDALQSTLTDMIKSKRVLLVLDDVWCYKSENEKEWEQLLTPLAFGKRGSKILVTSRPENMPNMPLPLRPQSIMKLKDLREDEFVSLFMHHAFGGTELSESHLREELEKIGKQILQKLRKSPLAAKAVGGQLSKRLQLNFWRDALEQDNLSDTQKALMWSYHRLDAPLQRCFSYFSLFPKGRTIKRKKMIHLWMAEGFINPSEMGKRMEDIGNDYFDELVSGSFLQLSGNYGFTQYYGMHDLFHDLAENISKEDCFRIEGDQAEKIPSTIHHLYIRRESMRRGMLEFHKLQNLRTLIVAGPVSKIDSDLLLTVMEKSKKLRVLDLSFNVSIKALRKCIRDLKHLRYLDLRFSSVAELPMSLGKLHHLQVLKSPYKVKVLPRSLRNLFNLRHLKAKDEALSTLPDIGRLTSLQKLKYFQVKKENGHDIRQLKNLNELRGSLTISGLEKVEGKDEATGANLKDKKHLDSLYLKWDSGTENNRRMNLDMEIVEALEPPPNLTNLEIDGCKSLRCPSWLVREGCLENLKSLDFNESSFKVLPTISSKLFPRCQELEIRRLPNLRTLPLLPQTLRKLVIESCPLLVFVSEEELQKSDDRKNSIMTVVRSSQLKTALELTEDIRTEVARECLDVKKLVESEKVDIPEDFQTFATALEGEEMSMQVDYLHLWEAYYCCQEQRLEAIFRRRERSELILPSELQHLKICSTNITDGALSLCLGGLSSLETLYLWRIRTITTVPTDHLMALCDLQIDGCHCLKSLGGLHALLSLKALRISSCPCLELEMMEGEGGGRFIFPPSLQSLTVRDNSCCNVKRFAIGGLPDLHTLHLDKWSSLASLSLSGLTALEYLGITHCPQLSSVDCSQAPNNSSLESLGGPEDVPKLAAAPPSEAVHLSSVEELEISSSATLSMLLSSNNSKSLVIGLRDLILSDCPEASFLEEHFSCLISLRSLSLYNCQVQSLQRILKSLSSLEHLTLRECPNISSLSDLPHSLLRLSLRDCPGILSLPVRLPESLRRFDISGCPVLKERCREPKGEDWPKIANIPRVSIYD